MDRATRCADTPSPIMATEAPLIKWHMLSVRRTAKLHATARHSPPRVNAATIASLIEQNCATKPPRTRRGASNREVSDAGRRGGWRRSGRGSSRRRFEDHLLGHVDESDVAFLSSRAGRCGLKLEHWYSAALRPPLAQLSAAASACAAPRSLGANLRLSPPMLCISAHRAPAIVIAASNTTVDLRSPRAPHCPICS